MTGRDRIAFGCHLVPALTLLAFGIRYLTASEFMPYHSAALGREWDDLLPNEQTDAFLEGFLGKHFPGAKGGS